MFAAEVKITITHPTDGQASTVIHLTAPDLSLLQKLVGDSVFLHMDTMVATAFDNPEFVKPKPAPKSGKPKPAAKKRS